MRQVSSTKISIRPFQQRDVDPVVNLANLCLTRDNFTRQVFERKVLLDPNFDPNGAPVVTAGSKLVGFTLAARRVIPVENRGLEEDRGWVSLFAVHPRWRRQGIGRKLFRHALDYLRREGRKLVLVSPYAPNYFIPGVDVEAYPEALQFLETLGFKKINRPLSMESDLRGWMVPSWVGTLERKLKGKGITVQYFDPDWTLPLLDFLREWFPGDWQRFLRDTLSGITEGRRAPDEVVIARRGDTIVGFAQHQGDRFGPFGTRDDLRGQGIGTVLLFRCLERMKQKGLRCAWFMWTSDEAAKVYSRASFREVRRFAIFRKEL